jgi:hypothetical protein
VFVLVGSLPVVVVGLALSDGRPLRPPEDVHVSSHFVSAFELGMEEDPARKEISLDCPADVSKKSPFGSNVNLLKKFAKLASPYN